MTEAERLNLLYDMNQRILESREITPLVRFVTHRVREMFYASGCALLTLDNAGEYLEFFFADQRTTAPSPEKLQTFRIRPSTGIAGRSFTTGKPILSLDAQSDPDLFHGVDNATGQVTRTVLCAPVMTPRRKIGVLEVINAPPELVTEDNLRFLSALAGDIAASYEIVSWIESLQKEAEAGRRALNLVSRSAVLGGIAWSALVLLLGSVWSSWTEALARPVFWFGVAVAAAGVAIARTQRRNDATA